MVPVVIFGSGESRYWKRKNKKLFFPEAYNGSHKRGLWAQFVAKTTKSTRLANELAYDIIVRC